MYTDKKELVVRLYVGITDTQWFLFLKKRKPDELNFWKPGAFGEFKAIAPGDLFLFKLHAPDSRIVGGGWFVRYARLPLSLAWEAFKENNGHPDFFDFSGTIRKYRGTGPKDEPDPVIGCTILSAPFFFDECDWLPPPADWKSSIVSGKVYDSTYGIGRGMYESVMDRLRGSPGEFPESTGERYGNPIAVAPRLGQGGFRVLVTESYHRRCAVTGEKTLPVLQAAHIKPYADHGPHDIRNGLLLRQDLHTLFDRGYMTVTEDLVVKVSPRIKKEFGNGREYYAYHDRPLMNVPERSADRPLKEYLLWHNEHRYIG